MEREKKEQLVVDYFKQHPDTYIEEISRETAIPRSSIQRYLHSHQNDIIPERHISIGEQLRKNKQRGHKKGGNSFFQNNVSTKDEKGHFTGSKREHKRKDKIEEKKKNILYITKLFLENPTITLEEFERQLFPLTKDYIYDCLTSQRTKEIIGEEIYNIIKELLRRNQYSFERKIKETPIEYLDRLELTEIEKKIIELRQQGVSQEEIACRLNLSHTTIMEYENRVIEQLNTISGKGKKQ